MRILGKDVECELITIYRRSKCHLLLSIPLPPAFLYIVAFQSPSFVKRCYVCRISDLAIHEHSHRNINPMKIPAFAQKTLPIDAQLFKIDKDRLEGILAVLPCYRQTP